MVSTERKTNMKKAIPLLLTALASLTIATHVQAFTYSCIDRYGWDFEQNEGKFCYRWVSCSVSDDSVYSGIYSSIGFSLIKNYPSKYARTWLVGDGYYHYPSSSYWYERDGWIHDDPFDPAEQTHYLGPMGYWLLHPDAYSHKTEKPFDPRSTGAKPVDEVEDTKPARNAESQPAEGTPARFRIQIQIRL
jgi:hypothetical protein